MRERRRLRAAGVLVLALALLSVGPAGATVLPPSDNPLPGSAFQGADGDQNDSGGRIDWQAMQAAGRAYHNPDPNAEDSVFESSKENEPGDWDLGVEADGATPAKSNVLDAWSAVDQSGGEVFLYLAFAREGSVGTTYVTFELNHDARLWDNGKAKVPCRHTGDILVSYQAEGTEVSVVIQRWVTLTSDPATTCARTGKIDDFSGLSPNVDAQGAINDEAITARLPGFYDSSVPRRHFGEAALNLSRLLDEGFDQPCFSFGSVWMHSRSSTSDTSSMQDYVAPRALVVRSCSASGVKFHDLNGNARRDTGEPGLPRYLIWADYDNDGIHDPAEPFAITDDDGQYVINDIRRTGTYMLRETIATARGRRRAAAADVTCSFPNDGTPGGTGSAPGGLFRCAWGPISTSETTYARGRDFGNYLPATLVVAKQLGPPTDPGRFDLLVNGAVVLAAAGDGASRAVSVDPGRHTVSETPSPGTIAGDYVSTAECQLLGRRPRLRSGPVYANVDLLSGQRALCTFWNVRRGVPAISIVKTGPTTAPAGATLQYTLYVSNTGDVSFPAAAVKVSDPQCDDPPELVAKSSAGGADTSPGTLDPLDTWTYRCSRKTQAPGDDCRTTTVTNTATASGTAGGTTVTDSAQWPTTLLCPPPPEPPQPQPPQPQPPQPQPPEPQPPSPVVPPGPVPPDAGEAARAALRIVRECVSGRRTRVGLTGARIALVRVYVNGELRRTQDVGMLQRLVTHSVRVEPGRRYRVTARVRFQRGSGNPSVRLTRVIRGCVLARVRRAPFTG